MQVKKFEAPTMQEALEEVKRELGPEAVILQTKTNRRGFGLFSKNFVELTVAISERSLQKKTLVEGRLQESSRESLYQGSALKQANVIDKYHDKYIKTHLDKALHTQDQVTLGSPPTKMTATRYANILDPYLGSPDVLKTSQSSKNQKIDPSLSPVFPSSLSSSSAEQEVQELKKKVEELKETHVLSSKIALDVPVFQDAFEQLVMNGVDRRYAYLLIKKASFELGEQGIKSPDQVLDTLANEMLETIQVDPLFSETEEDFFPFASSSQADFQKKQQKNQTGSLGPRVIALVGPTGVGKTTTLAKIASEAGVKRKLKVGLLNLDNYKVGAFDQLATYGKILQLPFRSASSSLDFKTSLQDFKYLDLILIDTTGRSQRDSDSLQEMNEILSTVENIQIYLTLSVTTRDIELYDIIKRFSIFNLKGLIISKLDEAMIYGAIYNITQKTKIPLTYFTTGQKVPDDIEPATAERVISLLMEI